MAARWGERIPAVPEEPVLGAAAAGGAAHVPRPRRPVRAPARQEALQMRRRRGEQQQQLRTERQQKGPRRSREIRGGVQGHAEPAGVVVRADQLLLLAGDRRLPRVHQAEFRARRGLRQRQHPEIAGRDLFFSLAQRAPFRGNTRNCVATKKKNLYYDVSQMEPGENVNEFRRSDTYTYIGSPHGCNTVCALCGIIQFKAAFVEMFTTDILKKKIENRYFEIFDMLLGAPCVC